jgi:hypothetical protein
VGGRRVRQPQPAISSHRAAPSRPADQRLGQQRVAAYATYLDRVQQPAPAAYRGVDILHLPDAAASRGLTYFRPVRGIHANDVLAKNPVAALVPRFVQLTDYENALSATPVIR